jgi:hypothetical protein
MYWLLSFSTLRLVQQISLYPDGVEKAIFSYREFSLLFAMRPLNFGIKPELSASEPVIPAFKLQEGPYVLG